MSSTPAPAKITINDLPYPLRQIVRSKHGQMLILLMYNRFATGLDPETGLDVLRTGAKVPRHIYQVIVTDVFNVMGLRLPGNAGTMATQWGAALKGVRFEWGRCESVCTCSLISLFEIRLTSAFCVMIRPTSWCGSRRSRRWARRVPHLPKPT